MLRIVSVDLAIRPASNGICLVEKATVTFPSLSLEVTTALKEYQRHWQDTVDGGNLAAEDAASAMADFLAAFHAQIIVIDGPQGFARSGRRMRRSEAILRTSGRTGDNFEIPLSGFSWPGIARLGIKLFNRLSTKGYARLGRPSIPDQKAAVEVFPDSCWHSFGLDAETLGDLQRLNIGVGLAWSGRPNEHQLDAAAGALAVLATKQGQGVFVGHPFFMEGEVPREGYIIIPNPGRSWWETDAG